MGDQAVEVKISKGRLKGFKENDTASFLGIPYAKAPVGKLRFKPPVSLDAWQEVLDATKFSASPAQSQSPMFQGDASEDCLYLNVWTPEGGRPNKPVLVWIYGGGFEGGSASTEAFSGAGLSNRGDTVVVTFNYRVGLLGFGLLSGAKDFESYSNLGVRDTIAALNWVQENIEEFGGDKHNVTVMGASAGGFIACSLISSPSASGLFQKLILISGGASRVVPSSQTELITRKAMALLEVSEREFKEVNSADLLIAQKKVIPNDIGVRNARVPKALGVTLDNDIANGLLTEHPMQAISAGRANHIPILSAASEAEISAFRRWAKDEDFRPSTYSQLVDEVESWQIDRSSAETIVQHYFHQVPNGDLALTRERILSDWIYRLPAARLADNLAKAGGSAWALEFRGTSDRPMGHGDEAPAIFDGLAKMHELNPRAEFRDELQEAILNFSDNGKPGWPSYDESTRLTRVMGSVSKLEAGTFDSLVNLWNGIERP